MAINPPRSKESIFLRRRALSVAAGLDLDGSHIGDDPRRIGCIAIGIDVTGPLPLSYLLYHCVQSTACAGDVVHDMEPLRFLDRAQEVASWRGREPIKT